MKRWMHILACALAVLVSFPAAAWREMWDITDLIRYVDRDTVLVIDIENTIIMPDQWLGTTKWGRNNVVRLEKAGLSHEQANRETYAMFHQIWSASPVRLVDPRMAQVINTLQNRGIKVIGLSNRDPSLRYVTSDQLAQVGIDLNRTALDQADFEVFSETETFYTDGVVLVGSMGDKGRALESFLRMVLELPKKVVVVDDRRQAVVDIEQALRSLRVEVEALWYRQREKTDIWAGYRQDVADVQERHFGRILSDNAATSLLQAGILSTVPTLAAGPAPYVRPFGIGNASYVESRDLRDVRNLIEPNTLVIIEVEDCLMSTATQLGSERWAEAVQYSYALPGASYFEARAGLMPLWNQILMRATMQHVDTTVQGVVRELQRAGQNSVMGLSMKNPEIAYTLLEHLRSVDVNFTKSTPIGGHAYVAGTYQPAKLVHGLLLTGALNDPGIVIANMLDQFGWPPRIVFISNNAHHLDLVMS